MSWAIWRDIVGLAAGLPLLTMTAPLTLDLLLLTAASLLPRRRRHESGGARRTVRLAVVIPAHDEEVLIERTVKSVLAAPGADRVIVVADNCSDRTAERAARAGAEVLVRTDSVNRGKGFALRYAFDHLTAQGCNAALVIDADSVISANLPAAVIQRLAAGDEVVQARYEVANRTESPRTRLMQLAFLAFNVLRALGRERLGLSAGLFGNGFAVGERAMALFEANSIVEDLEFHLSLLRAGLRVAFAEEAVVWGEMPSGGSASGTQRARWEGGRLRMARLRAGALLREILRGRFALVEPLVDLVGLPLAYHAAATALLLLLPMSFARTAGALSLAVIFFYALRAASLGEFWLNVRAMALAPAYVVWKVALAPVIIRSARADTNWVRTQRTTND